MGSIEHRLSLVAASTENPEEDREVRTLLLRSMWQLAKAVGALTSLEDYEQASSNLRKAARGFILLDRPQERDTAIGLALYSEGLNQVRAGNVGVGSTLVEASRKYLLAAGEFGSQYESLVDGMEVDLLALQAQRAFSELRLTDGEAHYRLASSKSATLANTFDPTDDQYNYWWALSHFYEALALFTTTAFCLAKFAFDRVPSGGKEVAERARTMFPEGAPTRLRAIAGFLSEYLGMAEDLAPLMTKVFAGTFKPDARSFRQLRLRVAAARDAVASEGADILPFITACDTLDEQLNNLERLATPKPKDFGIYSGIVASVTFMPVLVIFAIVNKISNLGASATLVVSTSLVLALIAGFGYGALKFRSLIPGIR